MEEPHIRPLAAFDIMEGVPLSVPEDWPKAKPQRGYRWLHLDIQDAATEVWVNENLPQIAALSLLQKETRPRCQPHADGLILNLRAVNMNPQSASEDMVSLRMWVTKDLIVSARVRRVFAINDIAEAAENGVAPLSVGRFIADLTHALVSRIESVSLELEEKTDEFEERVSENQILDPGLLGETRQTVIKLRRFVNPQREALTSLYELGAEHFSDEECDLLRETGNRTRRIVEELDATRDRLAALQEQIVADRTQVLGRNSYILSIVAAIFLPLGFLTGLFGVNVAGMPGTETEAAFWVLTSFSAISGVVLFLIFKLVKWL